MKTAISKTPEPIHLPAAVYDLAIRLGADPNSRMKTIRLTQSGRMKTKLESTSFMAFTATQTIAIRTCAFDWLAHFSPFGILSARDALADGQGRLDIKAFGLFPLARAEHSVALLRGELMRYLAEIPWAPDAILHNRELAWRTDGPDTIIVTAGLGDAKSEVTLSLNGDGRIETVFAADRPRSATKPFLPTPWRGRFSDYRQQGNVCLPYSGEVGWEIDGIENVYWRGDIKSWEAIPETSIGL